jgi:hypothetical protein
LNLPGVHPRRGGFVPHIRLCGKRIIIPVTDHPQVTLHSVGRKFLERSDFTLEADTQTWDALNTLLALDTLRAFGSNGSGVTLDALCAFGTGRPDRARNR